MLKKLTIDNLALLKNLEINFNNGMTCLTGETGAGKSIMLDAILLTLGDKCNPNFITNKNRPIDIKAIFTVDIESQAYHWLRTNNFLEKQNKDNTQNSLEITIHRLISKNENNTLKTKATINNKSATMQQLKQLGQFLIYIHGQHEHLNILKEQNQLKILDSYGKLTKLASEINIIYHNWSKFSQELTRNIKLQNDCQAKKQLLEFKISELQNADLKPNEWLEINKEYDWLANQKQYIEQLSLAYCILDDSNDEQASINNQLHNIVNILSNINTENDTLKNINDLINQALIQAQEAGSELRHFLSNQETDPELLNKLDQRLSFLHDLARKYKTEPESLLHLLSNCEQELANLNNVDNNIETLTKEISLLEHQYLEKATLLSNKRQAVANMLSKELTMLLKKLRMENAEVSILLQPQEYKPRLNGLENIIFLIKTNAGDNMKPLSQGVSGGELSRLALAIQVATAQVEGTPSLIFDEVDVGIGGGTAEIVGKLLRKMGQSTQVMCVTHLAQVAAQAENHIRVTKSVLDNKETATKIEVLDKQQRVDELARMIGGLTITKQTKAHAEELLEHASLG